LWICNDFVVGRVVEESVWCSRRLFCHIYQ